MEKYLPLLGLGIILVVLASGCTQQNVCAPPYIIKGGQCCMDQNNNGICDADEAGWNGTGVTPDQKNYTQYSVKMYVQDVYPESAFWKRLPASPPKNYESYQLYPYAANGSYWDGGWLYMYTRYQEEQVICLLKEYRDDVFTNQNVVKLDVRPETEDYYGASVQVLFQKDSVPKRVRYDVDCRGSESGITFTDAYAVYPVAP